MGEESVESALLCSARSFLRARIEKEARKKKQNVDFFEQHAFKTQKKQMEE